MKFIHLSDLHIGKHLYHYNMKEDQEHILEEVIGYTEKLRPDAVVIAGDIYDKSVPSAEAVAVFDDFQMFFFRLRRFPRNIDAAASKQTAGIIKSLRRIMIPRDDQNRHLRRKKNI